MRYDIAHVAITNNHRHRSTIIDRKRYSGRVTYVPDAEHLYEDEHGGLHAAARRDCITLRHKPIVGFLNKNVGRLWSEVYSEFCAVNDHRTLLGREMRKAISHEVKVTGIYEGIDGLIYEYRAGGYLESFRFDKDLNKNVDLEKPICHLAKDTLVTDFYVHPRTGLLCAPKCKLKGYDPFAYMRKKEPEPIETIVLKYGYVAETSWFGFYRSIGIPLKTRVPVEWYARELCGRRPRSRFYSWFHYVKKETVRTYWERVDGSKFAKNAHFEGVEVAPYVDPAKEHYYRLYPDTYKKDELGFWYVLKSEAARKDHKRSCNRKDMVVIRGRLRILYEKS